MNFSSIVPYDMDAQRNESREILSDLTTRDQQMMQAVVTMALTADSKEELERETETLLRCFPSKLILKMRGSTGSQTRCRRNSEKMIGRT